MLYQGALAKGYSLVDFCQVALLVSGLLPGGLAWAEAGLDRRWLFDRRPVVVEPCVRMAFWTLAWAGLECLPGCCKSIGRGAFRGGPDSLWLLGFPAGRDTFLLYGIAR